MIQLVKELALKPDDLSLIPEIHVVEGENQFLPIVLRCPHECTVHVHPYTHIQTKNKWVFLNVETYYMNALT